KGVELGHKILGAIGRLPFPTVALIDGPCMGGGTELALTLDERIASNNPQTKIGLPEGKVGLLPAWGGTQRLPRLIGVHPAVGMITSGEPVTAARAAALGLVFDVVPAERLVEEGCRLIDYLHGSGVWKENRTARAAPVGLTEDQERFLFAAA